ncbi:MAG: TolC family protein, partial [Bacteriovoracia bacterium]
MTSKRKNAFIVSSLALALGLFGGPAQAVPVLGLEQAYVSAIQKTETVPIAEATTRQAEELVSQAKGAIFPTINLVGTYTRQDTGNAPTSSFTDPVQYNARLNLNQPIFRGLREFAAVRGTNANYAAQVAAESQTRVELYRTVGDAFYGHLSAQQDLRNLNHLLELTEKRVAEINQRVRIGRSRNGESLTAQVQRSTVTAQLEAAKAVAAQAKRNFELVTGVSGEFSLQDSVQLPNPLPS